MNTISLNGALVIGGSCGPCGDGPITSIPVELGGCCTGIGYAACTGLVQRTISSPSAYVTLGGIGTDQAVTQATLLFFDATAAPMSLRMTTYALPDDVVAVVPLSGIGVWQFPSTAYLKLLEVQGAGAIEYMASGQL